MGVHIVGSGGSGGTGGTIQSITRHYTSRGYQEDPRFERNEGQVKSFRKPLPDGRQNHVKVFRGPKNYRVEEHTDKYDPTRNPVGHFQDIVFSPEHKVHRIRRKDTKTQ